MSDYDPNELDPIAFWVLLLLSGGQQFTFHDIVKTMDRSKESVWDGLQTLQSKKYAKNENSKFMIDFAGVEYLIKRGVFAFESEDEPKPKDFKKGIRPPFHFSTWSEMLIWLGVPFLLTFAAVAFDRSITNGYNYISMDKIFNRIFIWVLYVIALGLYIWRSYHYVMEHERIVVFFGGKAIGKKGPGHVLLLPFIYHPKRVDLREKSQEIKKEPCITRDNMLVNAGFYITWQIDDPILSLTKVSKVEDSMSLLSAAVLRATIAESPMEDALDKRRTLNALVRARIEHKAGDWGIQVNTTEIRELEPPNGVLKQIENRFNATLESEATLTKSDAQIESLRRLFQIGSRIDDRTFNLKYLDTLEKIGEGKSTKYIIPMEFFNLLQEFVRGQNNGTPPVNGNNPPGQLPPSGSPNS